jgi:hypothetical protein
MSCWRLGASDWGAATGGFFIELYLLWLVPGETANHSSQVQQSRHVYPQSGCRFCLDRQWLCDVFYWNRPGERNTDPTLVSLLNNPLSFGEGRMSGLTYHPDDLPCQRMMRVNDLNISRTWGFFRGILLFMLQR